MFVVGESERDSRLLTAAISIVHSLAEVECKIIAFTTSSTTGASTITNIMWSHVLQL